jgi:hypothetical protein
MYGMTGMGIQVGQTLGVNRSPVHLGVRCDNTLVRSGEESVLRFKFELKKRNDALPIVSQAKAALVISGNVPKLRTFQRYSEVLTELSVEFDKETGNGSVTFQVPRIHWRNFAHRSLQSAASLQLALTLDNGESLRFTAPVDFL